MTDEHGSRATVIYNDQCPVCSWEIAHYRDHAEAEGLPIDFRDLNDGGSPALASLTEDEAARRLYLLKDGDILSGIPAFIALWREMPRYRWLARIVALPGLRHAAAALYDHALAPAIYGWHVRRRRRKSSAGAPR